MTELMKRYEEETGRKPKNLFMGSEESLIHFTREYVEWLEAQLTWRPVSEKPEKDGEYFVKFHYVDGEEGMDVCDFTNGEWFWDDIISWLPIPPAPEGEGR